MDDSANHLMYKLFLLYYFKVFDRTNIFSISKMNVNNLKNFSFM